jgi:hypothetical protein
MDDGSQPSIGRHDPRVTPKEGEICPLDRTITLTAES